MVAWWLVDNSSLQGQIKEAVIQTIFWCIVLTILRYYFRIYVPQMQYFKHVATHEGGIDELITMLTVIPQHATSVILLWIGMTFDRTDIFTSAVLAEFGYELYDLTNTYIHYFLFSTSKSSKSAHEKANALLALKAKTFHHLPGVIVIIPAVHNFANDIYFQNVVWSLLSYAPSWLASVVAYKCADINDLNGRTQFTVYYVMGLLICTFGRFFWCPIEMYRFLTHTFLEQTLLMKFGLIFYAVLIYGFNLLVIIVSFQRLYKYMFVPRKKETEYVEAVKMLRRSSSTNIFTDLVANGLDLLGDREMIKKPKFKNYYTEPIKKHN